MNGEEFWKKYCGFFDLNFPSQLESCKSELNRYLEFWKNTPQAKLICPDGFKKFEEIRITSYPDYPILTEFGERVNSLVMTVPRADGELSTAYYDRLYQQVEGMLKDYIPGGLGFAGTTSGSTGNPKWMLVGKAFMPALREELAAMIAVACTDKPGTTRIQEKDKMLTLGASAPYGSAFVIRELIDILTAVPSIEAMERTPQVSRKIFMLLRELDKGHDIKFAAGPASFFHMVSNYITQREKLFKNIYDGMKWGPPRLLMLMLRLQAKLRGDGRKNTRDILPLVGLATFGFEAELYTKFFEEQYGLTPLNMYVSSELGLPMMGTPERKRSLSPVLRTAYLEFLDEKGEVKSVDQVKTGEVYEVIGTPFWSCLVRYRTGDLVRAVGHRDDGLPYFTFESRRTDILDIYGYYRLTNAIAVKALTEAGFVEFDTWAFVKKLLPEEHIELAMEKTVNISEEEVSRRVFNALRKVYVEFDTYVKDFNVKDPLQAIRVKYLKKGAFSRYMMSRSKAGVSLGQAKSPKIITPERMEIYEALLTA